MPRVQESHFYVLGVMERAVWQSTFFKCLHPFSFVQGWPRLFCFPHCHADEYGHGIYKQLTYLILAMQNMDQGGEGENDEQEITADRHRERHKE